MPQITIIAAVAENGAIGKNQQLLCHLPNDMKRFKELTTGHAVVMGRKTFESLPNGALPNRKNVVLTTMPEADFVNCFPCDSMSDALELCENEKEIFILGGALVYRQNSLMLTHSSLLLTGANGKKQNARISLPTKSISMHIALLHM